MSDAANSSEPPPLGQGARAMARWVWARAAEVMSIDLRALAAARIALGALVVWDVVVRLEDLRAHYTDEGFFPRVAAAKPLNPMFWLYFHAGTESWSRGLLLATGALGFALMIGLWSRRVAAALWCLLAALNLRNGWICNAGDYLLVNVVFWLAFLPLGARWSVDARRRDQAPPTRVAGPAAMAAHIQLMLLYLVAGIAKAGHIHWWRGEGVAYAFNADQFAGGLARVLEAIPGLTEVLSWATLLLEIPLAVALIAAPAHPRFRNALAATFIAFHLGIEATLGIGLFSWVAIACWLYTLPSSTMDRFERLLRRGPVVGDARGPASSPWASRAAAVLLAYMLVITSLRGLLPRSVDRVIRYPMRALSISDSWTMFTGPRRYTGWFVAPATLDDGRVVDAVRGGAALSWERPDDVRSLWSNPRWRKLYTNFPKPKRRRSVELYLQWLCRDHPEWWQVRYVHMRHRVAIEGPQPPTERWAVAARRCRKRARVPVSPRPPRG